MLDTSNPPTRTDGLSDTELMTALCSGCHDALAVLFERYSALVFRIARTIVRDDGEAEEVVQKVFLDVFRTANNFDASRGSFKTWLLQYAYHRSIDRQRNLECNCFYDLADAAMTDYLPQERFTEPEIIYAVKQSLRALEPKQRQVITLTFFAGLTAVEIAKVTKDTPSAVRHHLYRGMKAMRDMLSEPAKKGRRVKSRELRFAEVK
jgi:RNA polymerase sigma-70 factor, ECF subfamily